MFSKMLIANRGEIVCRIIRTARRMGVATVAVHSDADRDALHVEMADEAYAIGPAPAQQSYLDGRKVIAAALASGAEAIHPGYGFLSENAAFAEQCAEAGLVFIGPPASAIRAMGGKSEAKALMAAAGVPLVPGYHGNDQSPDKLAAEADKTGYPVLIKASAGGGGKGMRIVERPEDFAAELAGAKREALAAFGDDRMLIERYLVKPRHVEFQIFADDHGNCCPLYERDCSIQRRHQKVIEEAPAPGLPETLRRRMGEAAVAAAQAINYSGAGTVEFLLDASGDFYFMEMNTRLQVEHPVTEFITGLDLVEWQLRVAAGERLPATWSDLAIHGHAIEARIYAEDPVHEFLPSIGRTSHLAMPETGPNLRIDSGIRAGDAITVHYDPMIAKLVVWDTDRPSAVRRLQAALKQTAIAGVISNIGFLARLAGLPAFANAELDTGFIARHDGALLSKPEIHDRIRLLAAIGLMETRNRDAERQAQASADRHSPWARMSGFRLNGPARETLRFLIGGDAAGLTVTHMDRGYGFGLGARCVAAEGRISEDGRLLATIDGTRHGGYFFSDEQGFELFVDGERYRVTTTDPLATMAAEAGMGSLTAPMPGIIRSEFIKPGDRVDKGQALLVMEAMKMEHTVRAPTDGIVRSLNFSEGAIVEAGAVLVEIQPEDD